jgi:hypothetical protein
MGNISKNDPISERDIAYHRRRYKNRVFSQIVSFFEEAAAREGLTKRDIAERLDRDPATITRWLTASSNLTLDTVSDLLLALGGEMDSRAVRFVDRSEANYQHPIMGKILGLKRQKPPTPSSPPDGIVKPLHRETPKTTNAPGPLNFRAA